MSAGPWKITHFPAGQESPFPGTTYVWPDSWMVSGGTSTFTAGNAYANFLNFHKETEAIAVRDALNAVSVKG